uniref:Integrase catalytic domain-containing protein n=1 Tax=Tanacetum cinerariifolium TaxID=118510 RepID=A0A6L2K9U3_TANCI|nr:hypothetical protein [Tanacetum cinerariifolium]
MTSAVGKQRTKETSPFSQTIKNMMEDLLLLQAVLKEGNLVRGIPLKIFQNDHTCVACQKGKQDKASSKKDETSGILKDFITGIENQLNHKVKIIICDNGTEFKNYEMNQFCGIKGIKREFSNARTPQQNGVAERKNRTLIEAARTMLADSLLPIPFWAEAVNTTITILDTLDHVGKFDGKADKGFLVGYSTNSKAFRVYNSRTKKVEENLHVNFLENKPNIAGSGPEWLFDVDSLTNSMNYQPVSAGNRTNGIFDDAYDDRDEGAETDYNNLETVIPVSPIPSTRIHKDHPKEQIIGEVNSAIQTRKMAKQNEAWLITFINKQRRTNHKDFQSCLFACFLSQMEPKKTLVDLTHGKRAIRTKWVYRNKRDQRGIVVRNKARLDIMFVVCACSRFQVQPKVSHMHAVKRIFRYLKGQPTLVLWYPKDSPLELIAYSESDYAGASLDIKSTTRGCQFLGSILISWQCKKQTIMANFTTKAEYIAASS